MVQRRSYPRTPLERHGQVNWRQPMRLVSDVLSSEGDIKAPDCVIVVTKKKEAFGLLDNRESQTMSLTGSDFVLNRFPPERFFRYRVRIYLKDKRHDNCGTTY